MTWRICSVEFKTPKSKIRGRNKVLQLKRFVDANSQDTTIWLNSENLGAWFAEEKIIEFIFGETSHVELVKRSVDLLKFLAKEDKFEPEYVDLIWSFCKGILRTKNLSDKHEEQVLVTYNIISEIAQTLPLQVSNGLLTC